MSWKDQVTLRLVGLLLMCALQLVQARFLTSFLSFGWAILANGALAVLEVFVIFSVPCVRNNWHRTVREWKWHE